MFKRTILALSAATLLFAGSAQAQENATLVMRSGDRVSGQLVDLNASGFHLNVNGQERHIATGEVAVIEFSSGNMSDSDWSKVTDGQHVAWLKSGQTVVGQLYDIGGTTPLRLTFKTSSGEREVNSSDITRIALARPANMPNTGTAATPGTDGAFTVSARQGWVSTGISVRRGQTITLNTTGEIRLSNDANDMATAAGSKAGRYAPGAPLPGSLAGALIGKIGENGKPFGIGNQTSIPAAGTGILFLGINDDGFNDNDGEFRVEVKTTPTAPVRRR